jgi:beta-1,4-mannosyl-glycoprotein beta-1,4-N-acetylglucosaminyltransferase
MQAYSHSDRLGDHPEKLLRPERIQQVICKGVDIFDMLPEAYTYLDLFSRWKGSLPGRKTAVSQQVCLFRAYSDCSY